MRALLIGGVTIAAAIAIIIGIPGVPTSEVTFQLGEPAAADIIAPASITYVSQVQTNEAREAAAAAVPDVYDPADSRVTRQQVRRLQEVLDYVGSIRGDAFASREQKLADLGAVSDLTIDTALGASLLDLNDTDWAAIRNETASVIERVMSSRVREDRIEDARNQVPALVSVSLTEAQAEIVVKLVEPFITANSFFNEAATSTARQAARDAVAPISQSFVQGQTVVARGRVITEVDLEAMTALGIVQPELSLQNTTSHLITILLAFAIFGIFITRFTPSFFTAPRLMIFVGLLFLLFLFIARITVPNRTVLPFLFPSAALAMLVAVTLGPNIAVALAVIFGALISVITDGRLDVITYFVVGGVVAALAMGRAERISSFFWAGAAAAAANIAVILIYRLPDPTTDLIGIATLIGASLLSGILSAGATIVGLFILGSFFDIYTPLQMIELARPNHPLLQYVLRQAPGTYQHSLQVANLAEQAAERIGADTALVRVGAMFHDVGKATHPEFFIENQIEGQNPHDGMLPEVSAQVIIEHVTDGLKMAKKHRLPRVIHSFISQHHGTNLTYYQYQRAIKAAGGDELKVDKGQFRYPGPKPQTRESALLMLADGCESKSRADRPRNEEEIEKIVRYIIDRTLAANQLDECDLTVHDLKLVRESFVDTLKSFFHSRLTYPEERLPLVTLEEEELRR